MKKLRRYLLCLSLFVVWPSHAEEGALQFIEHGHSTKLTIENLRKQATTEFTIFAPFRDRKVKMKGVLLEDMLQGHFSYTPETIKLVAVDGYEVMFNDWQKGNWMVVTHEDGKPLTIRKQGPIRLVELNYGDKDPKNLRSFNDWVWMLVRIEVIK